MLELGALAFASPWILLAAAGLPVLWWLLRITPPAPRLMSFPPIRLLFQLKRHEETPARSPLWLLIMRLLIAALIIAGLSHPLFNPGASLRGTGPLILLVDDGWASAADWPARQAAINRLIDQAEREDRPVHVVTTAFAPVDRPIGVGKLMRPAEARRVANAIQPKPWPTDRQAALKALEGFTPVPRGSAHIAWLADGLGDEAVPRLVERLRILGSLQVFAARDQAIANLVLPPEGETDAMVVPVLRANGRGEATAFVRATGEDGRVLARERLKFADGSTQAQVKLDLPGELRNAVVRLDLEGAGTAGSAFLLDERWRRRPVGLVSGGALETDQPLLSALHFLDRALAPFAEVRRGRIEDLLARELAVLVLADIGKLTDSQVERLSTWVAAGGVVVRFAGPNMAQGSDALIPVALRGGGRSLGGAMSWSQPARLAPFEETSPFFGFKIPGDIRVQSQVLAEPAIELNRKTWVRLTDGTPLVTADKQERGWVILFHTTANTDWSNLAISGLFVDMLKTIVALSQGVIGEDSRALLPPLEIMDGFGRLGTPPSTATAIAGRDFGTAAIGPDHPPGFYGKETSRRALNLGNSVRRLVPLGTLPDGVERVEYGAEAVFDFKPWLLLAALVLTIADLLIAFALRGLIPAIKPKAVRTGAVVTSAVVLACVILGSQAVAQQDLGGQVRPMPTGPDAKALFATLETRLAYVITGDQSVDDVTRAGLIGLTRILRQRTAVEPAEPIAVNIETDELAFFPMLYWAVSPRQRPLTERATGKLNDFLRTGGTILFDTRERGGLAAGIAGDVGEAGLRLRVLLRGLDVPALFPVPEDHVLTKSFYLMSEFPGRYAGGQVWVERLGGRHNDGVSSIIIGSNDWAAAWAVDDFNTPMFPVVPGGDLQREFAYRFGVNWVMYALTGNYKTDQVHVPAIIERLGQ